MIIQHTDLFKKNQYNIQDVTGIQIEYYIDFINLNNVFSSNMIEKKIIIGSYYNIIENLKFIKNISIILKKIKSLNIKNIQIQIPFIKQSLLDTIKNNIDISLDEIISFFNDNNITIEFTINNYLDIYLIKNLIGRGLNENNVKYSLGPQFFFINYDPLNLLVDRKNELNNFAKNINIIKNKFENRFNLKITSIYFFEAHIIYFYGLENYLKNKEKFRNVFIKEFEKNSSESIIQIILGKNILSITDRIYHYFEKNNNKENNVSTRISNKEIYQWLFNNLDNLQNIKGQYNYEVFKGLDKNNSLKNIEAYYENNYEFVIIK